VSTLLPATVLAVDTATERLGVALLVGDRCLVRHQQPGTGHANLVLGLVAEVLEEGGLARNAIDAIAFGRGPGAFTGLRIAVGVAQGLGLALDRPVVPVSTLRTLAAQVVDPGPVVALIDARMGEFYAAAWASGEAALAGAEPLLPEALLGPAALLGGLEGAVPGWRQGIAAGPGWPALHAAAGVGLSAAAADAWPDAGVLARLGRLDLAHGGGVRAELARPEYLRNQVAVPKGGWPAAPVTPVS
jgi:tRNA threonylcarbamoyladenosine biosynthesis protein TsaB